MRTAAPTQGDRVIGLISTSVDDLRSSLVHFKQDSIPLLNEALEACVRDNLITKQNVIENRLRALGHFTMCESCGRVKCHPSLDLCYGCKKVICSRCMDNASLQHSKNGAHAMFRAHWKGVRQ